MDFLFYKTFVAKKGDRRTSRPNCTHVQMHAALPEQPERLVKSFPLRLRGGSDTTKKELQELIHGSSSGERPGPDRAGQPAHLAIQEALPDNSVSSNSPVNSSGEMEYVEDSDVSYFSILSDASSVGSRQLRKRRAALQPLDSSDKNEMVKATDPKTLKDGRKRPAKT